MGSITYYLLPITSLTNGFFLIKLNLMKIFILAGGFATRLWPLTEKRAKPLLPLAGEPLLTHLIKGLPQDLPIYVSTNAVFETGFKEWTTRAGNKNIHVTIEAARKDGEKLGALGAFAAWLKTEGMDDDVMLLTGDNYFGVSLKKILDAFDGKTTLIAVHDVKEKNLAKGFGTVIASGTKVTGFEEKPPEPKSSLVSTGCSVIPKSLLPNVLAYAEKKPDNVGGLFEELLQEGFEIQAFEFSEPWLDIGSFHAYLEAHRLIVGGSLHAAPDTHTEGSSFTGSVAIGHGSTVKNSDLTDCIIFENALIEDCTLRHCIVDNNCVLKGVDLEKKMLREGTRLELS